MRTLIIGLAAAAALAACAQKTPEEPPPAAPAGAEAPVATIPPALGEESATWTNGRRTLTIAQGTVSYAVGRRAAEACTPG